MNNLKKDMVIQEASRLQPVKEYYFSNKLQEIEKMNQSGLDVLNLGIGNPDLPPSQSTVKKLEACLRMDDSHRYQSYRSIGPLREAFSKWYRTYYNVVINPQDEILPLMGSKEGIFFISMAFLDPGDGVLVPDPGYPTYASAALLAGGKPRTYKLTRENGWYPDLDVLEKEDINGVKIMWINYPHMPTGAKPNLKLFHDLVKFGRRHEILICHDNPYSFILNNDPMSIFEIDDARDVALELNSLSKSHNMPGWRMGMLCGHREYLNAVLKVHSNVHSGMFRPVQESAVEALANPPEWYVHLNAKYQIRRQLVWELLDVLKCSYATDQAGLFVWASIPEEHTGSRSYTDRILEQARVFITPGFVFGNQGNRYIRISLCNDEKVLLEARERLIQNLQKIEN